MSNNNNDSNLGNMKIFAENFNYYLDKSGNLKKDVAKKIGVSACTISDWVKCRTYPRMDKIEKLADLWGINMSDLVEKRSLENNYFITKEAKETANELINDPESLSIYQAIKKLSPTNKEIVLNLINSLNGGGDK